MQEDGPAEDTEQEWPEEKTKTVGVLEAQGRKNLQRLGWPQVGQMHRVGEIRASPGSGLWESLPQQL